ncbi:DnaB-like helicase C-terminal domain-containing protein [Streptomyces flaveolus]|uniref:DnaB-like helicase C-terminal domain-containing protein n=1 Tax=Streptomyces flaveolus TaxID=67297 RepID=UPI0033D7AF5D
MRSRIKTIIRETGRAPLVVVDYLQLMQTDQRNARQTPYERVTEISRELKILASDTGAVLVALAQLNRGPEQRQDKRPAVSDLGADAHDAGRHRVRQLPRRRRMPGPAASAWVCSG